MPQGNKKTKNTNLYAVAGLEGFLGVQPKLPLRFQEASRNFAKNLSTSYLCRKFHTCIEKCTQSSFGPVPFYYKGEILE